MYEVLINENLDDDEQLVIQTSLLPIMATSTTGFGPINIAAGSQYLMAIRSTFQNIYGFQMCGYSQQPLGQGLVGCFPLSSNFINLNAFSVQIISCDTFLSDPILMSKK